MSGAADAARRPLVAVLVGTTRTARVGRQLAEQVASLVGQSERVQVKLVDLAEIALPWLDEPRPPSAGDYQLQSTRDWAAEVSSWDAVVVVTAQYNGGYPAPLKNAIDTVYAEWAGKPTAIVTYGGHRSAGGRSSGEQLRTVFQVTRNEVIEPGTAIVLDQHDYDENLHLRDATGIVEAHREALVGMIELVLDRLLRDQDAAAAG